MSKHDDVVKALKELAEKYEHYNPNRIFPYLDKREPIKLPFDAYTIDYYPDLWVETKRQRRIDVYEVWHTESEGEAIADIYLMAKIPNLLNICIVCVKTSRNCWSKEDAENIVYTVLKDLEAKYPSLKSIRTQGHIYIAEVGEEELKNKEKLLKSLSEQLQF
ncbi:MAG: hypothetical protein QXS37_06490 [Candidatus Aenigmatarchaeota archaeon]